MDKYSQYALKTIKYKIFKESVSQSNLISEENNLQEVITVKQNYNYTIDQYYIAFIGNSISSITFDKKTYNNSETNSEVDVFQPCIIVPVIYSKKIDSLVLELQGGILDPISISMQYEDADKKVFDEKMYAEKQAKYKKTMHFTCRTGASLVNLHWQNACDEVASTEISFFAEIDGQTMLIEKKEFSSDAFFHSIINLAYGYYKAVITQKDETGKTIITAELTIQISNPFIDLSYQMSEVKAQVAASGRNVVYGR